MLTPQNVHPEIIHRPSTDGRYSVFGIKGHLTTNDQLAEKLEAIKPKLLKFDALGLTVDYALIDAASREVEVSINRRPTISPDSFPDDEFRSMVEDLMYEALNHHYPGWDDVGDNDVFGALVLDQESGVWLLDHHDRKRGPKNGLGKPTVFPRIFFSDACDPARTPKANPEQVSAIKAYQKAMRKTLAEYAPCITYSCEANGDCMVLSEPLLGIEFFQLHKLMDQMLDSVMGVFAPNWSEDIGCHGKIARSPSGEWALAHHPASGPSERVVLWRG